MSCREGETDDDDVMLIYGNKNYDDVMLVWYIYCVIFFIYRSVIFMLNFYPKKYSFW